jgi:hypothetical protein
MTKKIFTFSSMISFDFLINFDIEESKQILKKIKKQNFKNIEDKTKEFVEKKK